MWTKKLKRSFALPLVMVRNMIFDFLRKVECDGQKIVVESLIVGIQVYRNYKVTPCANLIAKEMLKLQWLVWAI